MVQKNQGSPTRKLIIQLILLTCLVLAGLELFYNLRNHINKQGNTAPIPSASPAQGQDTLRTNTSQDSLLWEETEFMD